MRDKIALLVVLVGASFLALFSLIYLYVAPAKEEAARAIMTGILPLLGTWIGTILAFYFAKENFEAASRNTKELLGLDEKLRSMPADLAAIPLASIEKLILNDDMGKVRITGIISQMQKTGRHRLPLLNSNNVVKGIIHLSTATEFVSRQLNKGTLDLNGIKQLSLDDLKEQAPDLYGKLLAVSFINRNASLADAKIAMESTPHCEDVFVTTSGKENEPIFSWITNVEITRHCKV